MLRPFKLRFANRPGFILVLSLPILLFCFEMLLTGNRIPAGDPDYLMQTSIAARESLLQYRQFPWWNPWISGGVPLFANPQFGLLSLPMLFAIPFGGIIGYKLAIATYFLLGFYGLLLLFRKGFKTPLSTSILLSYIWTFGTFLTYRSLGHYTFLTIQFLPLALYFLFARNSIKRSWLYFGIVTSLAALAAAHNMTILSFLLLSMFIFAEILKLIYISRKKNHNERLALINQNLMFFLKAGFVFIILTGYRLFFTLQYLQDYPRSQIASPEPTVGIGKALFAIFGPVSQFYNTPQHPQWSWMEASAYIGLATGVAALLVLFLLYRKRKKIKRDSLYMPSVVAGIWGLCFLLGLGAFAGRFSPYLLMRHLPILSSIRVATRWLALCSFLTLIFIALYKRQKFRRVINILLLISVIELFVLSRPQLDNPYIFPPRVTRHNQSFEQQTHFNVQRGGIAYDENLSETTLNNYGQIIAGDALIDTREVSQVPLHTKRCDVDEGCPFVMSRNARVNYWSPNKIILERTGSGSILLNMNPGSCWLVNNTYIFTDLKVSDPEKDFIIADTSSNIELKCQPRFSLGWLFWKFSK